MIREGVFGAELTTFRIGGPIDLLVEARAPEEVQAAVSAAAMRGASITPMGGGSNTLIADAGVRGVVLRYRGASARLIAPDIARVETGLTFNGFVRWCISHSLSGYEAWAGTPGTIGGAIHGNAHFQNRWFSERVLSVRVVSLAGELITIEAPAMDFGYDRSRLQASREIAISVDVRLAPDDPERLRRRARESLAYRKKTQPLALPSAGCIFQNPDPSLVILPEGVPASAGALIDRVGLKGARRGGARISEVHANFIVSDGRATASDVLALIEEARERVADRFGVELADEIVRMGVFS